MPWHVAKSGSCPDSRPWAVVKNDTGEIQGCHASEESAMEQMAALYAKEQHMTDLPDELRVIGLFQFADGEPTGDPPRAWIQVMVTGEFKHPRYGKFTISEDDLAGYAEDIGSRGERIPIDFDHASAEGRTEAAGWYTGETEIKPDRQGRPSLFAEVEFTPVGADAIRSKRYRFISPEFSRTFRDATGKLVKKPRMWATALTNRPFLPEMDAVTLSEFGVRDVVRANLTIPMEMRATLAEKLGIENDLELLRLAEWSTAFINDLPDSSFLYVEGGGEKDGEGKTTPRSLRHFPVKDGAGKIDLPHLRNAIARIPQSNIPAELKERLQARARRMLGNQGGDEAADQPDTTTATDSPEVPVPDTTETETPTPTIPEGEEEMDPKILAALDLPEHADTSTILAALEAKDAKIKVLEDKATALETQTENNKTLAQQVKALEARDRKREIDAILSDEVRTGRVLPVEIEQLSGAFADDPEALKALLNARPPGLFADRMREHGSGGAGIIDQQTREVARELKLDGAVDEHSAKLHSAAMGLLEARGKKTGYTEADYMAALEEAQRSLALSY